ncbi:MAG: DUF3237 domain-containing protein [Candidatus Binatia bacterium]
MKLTPLFELHINLGIPVSAGQGPYGRRVFYPLLDGTFAGVEPDGTFRGAPLRGTIVPGGGDWVLISDTVSRLDIRLTLKTDDGWPIYLQAFGIIAVNDAVRRRLQDPNLITDYGETYFMTQPRFETGDDLDRNTGRPVTNPYQWLNDVVVVGQGKLGPSFPGFMAAQWLETRSFVVEN